MNNVTPIGRRPTCPLDLHQARARSLAVDAPELLPLFEQAWHTAAQYGPAAPNPYRTEADK